MTGSVVAIVGGGFSGVVSAVRLLDAGAGSIRKVVLIEKQPRIGRGVAYGTRDDSHLLNVPAGRMSAFPEDPDHFLRFARSINYRYFAGDFLPRTLYGAYLESLLQQAIAHGPASINFARVQDSVTDIQPTFDGRWKLQMATGDAITADKIILACGNLASKDPLAAFGDALVKSSRYISDPWANDALVAVDFTRPVLLLGSGLTAVDVACWLVRRDFSESIHMVSRHGLQAISYHDRAREPATVAPEPSTDLLTELHTVRTGLRALRAHIQAAKAQGYDWRDAMLGLRRHVPSIWQNLSPTERGRFLRHLRHYWDVHRHRIAPNVAALLEQLVAAGTLHRHAGRVTQFTADADGMRAMVHLRHSTSDLAIDAGTVINCTGQCTDLDKAADPLLANLHRRGLCTPDALRLGLECADNYALVDTRGRASQSLFYVGPFLRAKFWEATAVPELREHVANLVRGLVEPHRTLSAPGSAMRVRA